MFRVASHQIKRFYSCVRKKFEEFGIVPDVLRIAPEKLMAVSYSNKSVVNLGNTLTPTEAKCIPNVRYEYAQSTLYTIAMIDPDAPSRSDPKYREWLHWLVVNIKGIDVKSGTTLAHYIGAGPPEGTECHRYIFLVYQQRCTMEHLPPPLTNCSADGRPNFSIKDFATCHDMCHPIAGNFFQAQYDNYVPELYRQLGL